MRLENDDMMKILDFILENKNIIIGNNGLFSRETLIMIRAIVKGKIPNNFELTPEQEQLIITTFINSNNTFNEDTPSFILTNEDCINVAIERDINSANFIEKFTPELSQKVLNLALNKKYILTPNSPAFLESNYEIALNSIRQDSYSANYVDWNAMRKEDFDILIQETIKSGYTLSSESCIVLTENPDIVLNSITKDMNTLQYSSEIAQNHPKVFKYLVSKGHEFSNRELNNKPLSVFTDNDTMKYALKKLTKLDTDNSSFDELWDEEIDEYIERFIEFYVKGINTPPTIRDFYTIFQVSAELNWEEHRKNYVDNYANIFGKICTELRENSEYSVAVDRLHFLSEMKEALDDKYNLLLQAMEQYHTIIHSNIKLDNLDFARNQIAKLSALYVSISKENFKKAAMENYFEYVKMYFIPRKDHPFIYKKLVEYKYKKAFKELYQNNDSNILCFLKDLVKQNSEKIDEDTIWCMINYFVNNGYSKMDNFIKAPCGWNNYKRYKESSKLINRLNSHYIKYTDQELVRYLDIIKYDIKKDKYYYTGPSFREESIVRFNEYSEKLQLFDKIKKQIILKAKELKIYDTISLKELTDIAGSLPFNDEYFEFSKSTYNIFKLENFINLFIDSNGIIEPNSLIDDETYNILTNYAIDNALVWILLIISTRVKNISVDKNQILATFDYMEKIISLAKTFDYNINKFEDVLTLCEISKCADEKSIAILGQEVISTLCENSNYVDEKISKVVKMATKLVCEMTKRNKSTVPYINGTYGNYKYSMYDSQDETILLAGINTDACFRIGGYDNDFLHYCALDKNGFVIKITDNFGNFIGRASGFRNGNAVYINQLRTIYDEGGDGYKGCYVNEQLDIIDVFKQACNDIVEISQKNNEEYDKIDFVFVTNSYALENIESNVSAAVEREIGSDPMDMTSDDWKNFVNNTENLEEADEYESFSTDYENYSITCMASSKKDVNNLKTGDIKPKDVKAVYTRPRNKIVMTNEPDINIINKINKINGINSYLNETDFEKISLPKGSTIFIGDNWYIVFDVQKITSSCVLDFDEKAKIEFEGTKTNINQHIINHQQFSLSQMEESLQSQELDNEIKILKLHLKKNNPNN